MRAIVRYQESNYLHKDEVWIAWHFRQNLPGGVVASELQVSPQGICQSCTYKGLASYLKLEAIANMNDEHTILNHYSLTNPFPRSWPTEKDDSEDSGEEKSSSSLKAGQRRSKSRYSALERRGSDGRRSLVPGSQKLRDGQENLVQRDEPDPLGASDSVVRVLRQKGLPVEEDSRLSEIYKRKPIDLY